MTPQRSGPLLPGRQLLWLVVLTGILAACGGAGSMAPRPSDVPPPASPPLGTFDLSQIEGGLGVAIASAAIENDLVRYVGDAGQIGFDFVVDPDEDVILESSFSIGDSRLALTADESGVRDAWFAVVAEHQPEATAWLRGELDALTDAGGAEYAVDNAFGDHVLAGLYATNLPPELDDDLFFASFVELYIQDRRIVDWGTDEGALP